MPDEGARPELVRGELRVITPAGAEHGRVAMTPAGAEHRRVAMTPAGAEHGRAAMTPAGAEHGRVAMTLGLLLAGHVRQHGIGIAFEEKALMWLQGGARADVASGRRNRGARPRSGSEHRHRVSRCG